MLRLFDMNGRDITDELDYCSNPSCLGEPWCSAWGICKAQEPVEQAMELETRHGLQSESEEESVALAAPSNSRRGVRLPSRFRVDSESSDGGESDTICEYCQKREPEGCPEKIILD